MASLNVLDAFVGSLATSDCFVRVFDNEVRSHLTKTSVVCPKRLIESVRSGALRWCGTAKSSLGDCWPEQRN